MIVTAILVSAVTTYLLVRYSHLHASATGDFPVGPQKFHTEAVPRVGGLGIVAGFLGSLLALSFSWTSWTFEGGTFVHQTALLLLCSVPALAGGLGEDVTKRVGVGVRLGATMIAAGLAFFALDGVLDHVDVAGLDAALGVGAISLAFTMVAVGGTANALNIIDGYNGLTGAIAIFIFSALAYVSFLVGDSFLLGASLAMMGALAGFLPWNFPRGRIFLGDGGAYFVGFMIGEISVLLVRRHSEVSPWYPLLLVAYPVWETLFSIYRKKIFRGQSPGEPDGLHLHQLVYRRVMRWKVGSRNPRDRLERNSFTSPYLWAFSLTTIIPAMIFWQSTVVLAFWAFGFAFLYVWLYRRIVAFRVPRWIILWKPRASPPAFADEWESCKSRDGT